VDGGDQRRPDPKGDGVKYMLMLIGEEGWTQQSEDEIKADMAKYDALDKELRAAGKLVSGEGLQESATATTLKVRNGERIVSDGPFAETKEQLGGFYVLECENLDDAIEWAAKIPAVQHGTIEIRPVFDYEAVGFEDKQKPVEAGQ
jgi:hypothetical protein